MEAYKTKYNKLLKRYYNGCEYLRTHPDEWEKYLQELMKIQEELGTISSQYDIKPPNVLNGFTE